MSSQAGILYYHIRDNRQAKNSTSSSLLYSSKYYTYKVSTFNNLTIGYSAPVMTFIFSQKILIYFLSCHSAFMSTHNISFHGEIRKI